MNADGRRSGNRDPAPINGWSDRHRLHWARSDKFIISMMLTPYVVARIAVLTLPLAGIEIPIHATFLVHGHALLDGDRITPSAITYIHMVAIPFIFIWNIFMLVTRPPDRRIDPLAYIFLAVVGIPLLRMAYIEVPDPGFAIDHYSTKGIGMSSNLILSAMLFSINCCVLMLPAAPAAYAIQRMSSRQTRKKNAHG